MFFCIFCKKNAEKFCGNKKSTYLCTRKRETTVSPMAKEEQKVGAIAQLVEQRTENPCVPGSIPGGTTEKWWVVSVSVFILKPYGNFFYP